MAKRIFAVLGDYYHKAEWSQPALHEAVAALNRSHDDAEYELETIPFTSLGDALQERPDLLVVYKEQRLYPEAPDVGEWMDGELQERIVRYVESGGALLAWHSGLAYREDGPYRQMLRGWFLHHPKQKPVTYVPAQTGHKLDPEDVLIFKDEHYFVHCEESRTNVFLLSESEDGRSIAGWTHDIGQGRVCCLTPAHTLDGLQDKKMIELLANCLRYCLSSQDDAASK